MIKKAKSAVSAILAVFMAFSLLVGAVPYAYAAPTPDETVFLDIDFTNYDPIKGEVSNNVTYTHNGAPYTRVGTLRPNATIISNSEATDLFGKSVLYLDGVGTNYSLDGSCVYMPNNDPATGVDTFKMNDADGHGSLFTVEAVFMPTSYNGDTGTVEKYVIGKNYAYGWAIRTNNNKIYGQITDLGGNNLVVECPYTYTINEIYYVAMVFNKGNLYLYVNGELVAQNYREGSRIQHMSTRNCTIGAAPTDPSALGTARGYFEGYIDSVTARNRAMTEAEIQTKFTALALRVDTDYLKGAGQDYVYDWNVRRGALANGQMTIEATAKLDTETLSVYFPTLNKTITGTQDNKDWEFAVDTADFDDGSYDVELRTDTGVGMVRNSLIVIDNTPPNIYTSVKNGETVHGSFTLSASSYDETSSVASLTATLDGRAITLPYQTSVADVGAGAHSFAVTAVDKAGNASVRTLSFTAQGGEPTYANPQTYQDASGVKLALTPSSSTGGAVETDFYRVQPAKSISAYEGQQRSLLAQKSAGDEVALTADSTGSYVSSAVDAMPYQLFDVNVSGQSGDVVLSWVGGTRAGERMALYAWNVRAKQWDKLESKVCGGPDISLTARVKQADYAENGVVRAMVAMDLTDNGSDTILWFTDTQFYTREFVADGTYEAMTDWIANQYAAGEFAFAIHTGDLIQDRDVITQWLMSDAAQATLDDAGVPNSVVSGNHDVEVGSNVNYTNYYTFFGENRYNDNTWYGGSFSNNMHSYQLFTAAGRDFIVLNLGYKREATDETVAWANEVLSTYSHRNAIITLHVYTTTNGAHTGRAADIYKKIVEPNDNVIMVLSGHIYGAARMMREVEGADRTVVEMLSDYQDFNHGGDGYLRLMTFGDGYFENVTYSPTLDDYNCFDPSLDEFTSPVDIKATARDFTTVGFAAGTTGDTPVGSTALPSGKTATVSAGTSGGLSWYAVIRTEGRTVATPIFSRTFASDSATHTPIGVGSTISASETATATSGDLKIEGALSDDNIIVINMTSSLADKILQTAQDGVIEISVADNDKVIGMLLKADKAVLAGLGQNSLLLTLADGASVYISAQALAEMIALAGDGPIEIEVIYKSISVSITQNGRDIPWKTVKNPLVISLPYRLGEAGSGDNVVIYQNRGAADSRHIMPRSWFSDGVAYAKVYSAGAFDVMYADVESFGDTSGKWMDGAVNHIAARSVTNGVAPGLFDPDSPITRAQFITMLMRMLDAQDSQASLIGKFSDAASVPEWAVSSVAGAAELGIVYGDDMGNIRPNDLISRQDMFVITHRAMTAFGMLRASASESSLVFADWGSVADYASDAVQSLLDYELIQGDAGMIMPLVSTSRAHAAQFLCNVLRYDGVR